MPRSLKLEIGYEIPSGTEECIVIYYGAIDIKLGTVSITRISGSIYIMKT